MPDTPYTALQVNCLTETGYIETDKEAQAKRALDLTLQEFPGYSLGDNSRTSNRRYMRQQKRNVQARVVEKLKAEQPPQMGILIGWLVAWAAQKALEKLVAVILNWVYSRYEQSVTGATEVEGAAQAARMKM